MGMPDYSFVEAVNKDTTIHWKAKVHDQFKNKKIKHMHKLLGKRKFKRVLRHQDGHGHDQYTGRLRNSPPPKEHDEEDIKYLKTAKPIDWRNKDGKNYITPVK